MSQTKTIMKGVIRGRTIELDAEPGLPDGQAVSVIVQPVAPKNSQEALEALKRAAGAWANDDPEGLEQYLEQTHRQRKIRREFPEWVSCSTLISVDLLNAAIALVYNMTMVTHNVADYSLIPGLTIDDWLAPWGMHDYDQQVKALVQDFSQQVG